MFQIQVSGQEADLERYKYQIKLLKQLVPPIFYKTPVHKFGGSFYFCMFLK